MMRRPEVRTHPQLTVHERGDGLGGEMLRRAEPARTDGRITLRRERRGQPRECTAEHVPRVDHRPAPLQTHSSELITMAIPSNVARLATTNTHWTLNQRSRSPRGTFGVRV